MDPVRRAHIRRDLRNALTDEALYANEQWWREFARNPEGCPLERFRVFGGVLANATPEEVKDAFPEGSSDVVAVDAATGLIRPVRTPSADNHIFRRTVFVQPIPFYAVDNDITTFFSKWGKIEKLQRREWMDYKDPRNPVLRKKPSVFVVYRTKEEADKCVESKPTFAAATGLGRHFIPELHVEIRKSVDPDENAAIPKAPAAIETPAASAAADTLHLSYTAKQNIVAGFVVTVSGIPRSASWRDIREQTQQHVLSFEKMGKWSRFVTYTLHDAANGRAFMFFKEDNDAERAVSKTASFTFKRSDSVCTLRLTNREELAWLETLPATEMENKTAKKARGGAYVAER
eukprot:Rhum_TRINITY_DN18829_c0_g1::Rhum_TRINITY_DN18829_c0_g1_i1::g.168548::m.168548